MTLPFNSCTSIKVIGDPVDGIRYKQSQYDFNLKRNISLELKSDESIDTVDVDSKSPTIKKQELGFDLMSLTSARGHFVDKVSKGLRNNKAITLIQYMINSMCCSPHEITNSQFQFQNLNFLAFLKPIWLFRLEKEQAGSFCQKYCENVQFGIQNSWNHEVISFFIVVG